MLVGADIIRPFGAVVDEGGADTRGRVSLREVIGAEGGGSKPPPYKGLIGFTDCHGAQAPRNDRGEPLGKIILFIRGANTTILHFALCILH